MALIALQNGTFAQFNTTQQWNAPPLGVVVQETSIANTVIVSTAGYIKMYNGTSFLRKPVKVWNGSSWVIKPLKRWNGSSWVVIN